MLHWEALAWPATHACRLLSSAHPKRWQHTIAPLPAASPRTGLLPRLSADNEAVRKECSCGYVKSLEVGFILVSGKTYASRMNVRCSNGQVLKDTTTTTPTTWQNTSAVRRPGAGQGVVVVLLDRGTQRPRSTWGGPPCLCRQTVSVDAQSTWAARSCAARHPLQPHRANCQTVHAHGPSAYLCHTCSACPAQR